MRCINVTVEPLSSLTPVARPCEIPFGANIAPQGLVTEVSSLPSCYITVTIVEKFT